MFLFTFSPAVFLHRLNDDDEEESEEVEALSDVAARHLEQIVFVELLEHAALQLNELKF
jgi:hypothetical protein